MILSYDLCVLKDFEHLATSQQVLIGLIAFFAELVG